MLDSNDTIFAPVTATGCAGVNIIRISGPKASEILMSITDNALPKPRIASLRKLINPSTGDLIDEALVLWFPSPQSFTGEDVVELHTHANQIITHALSSAFMTYKNCRLAEPGEFSRRAFEHGKMDLTQLEGLADLIDAQTVMQHRQALRQMQGELENLYDEWRTSLLDILAHTEAYIDFPDEDIPEDLNTRFENEVSELLKKLQPHLEDRRGEIIREGLYAVILGAPNVGKSSLLNFLAKRDVAIVSDIAGTTRDVIEVHLDVAGYPLTICDTAGLREQNDTIEAEGIRRAHIRAEHADIKFILFDTTKNPDESSLKLIDEKTIVVVNKSDLKKSIPDSLFCYKPLIISVTKEEGIDEFFTVLEKKLSQILLPSSDPVFTRERHRVALQDCVNALTAFLKSSENNSPIELRSEELRLAAESLGKITGKIDVEEILGEIFSQFCIGK